MQGILMYIQSQSNPSMHLGKFLNLDLNNFKWTDPALCAAANVTGDNNATFTHANPSDKPLSTVFEWQGSKSDLEYGDLVVRAVLTNLPDTPKGAKPGSPRWMDLAPVNLNFKDEIKEGQIKGCVVYYHSQNYIDEMKDDTLKQ
jgi:hypothetical protein